jgi:hypothetical protein
MSDILTLADFGDNLNGFGAQSQEQVDDLVKALGTGTDGAAYGNGQYNDGSAARPQSLESTLKIVTAKDKHIKLWKDLSKKPAFNTVEEYNILDSYGGDASPFFTEGGLPNEQDSHYVRKSALVKFLGTTRVITHPMTLVRSAIGDVVGRESNNGTLWLLQQMERSLFFGDSSVDPLSFDGIYTQMLTFLGAPTATWAPEQIIDLKGQPLTEEVLEDGANIINENYGTPGKLYLTPSAHKDLSKILFPRERGVMPFAGGEGTRMGAPVPGFNSNAGYFQFENDIFLRPGGAPRTVGANGSPAAPTIAGVATPVSAVADTTNKPNNFNSNYAGTYYYWVSSKNSAGESVPVFVGSAAIAAGQAMQLTINRVTSAPAALSYVVYRGTVNDSTKALKAFEIADVGGAPTTQNIMDTNADIPGTSKAFLLDLDSEESLTFKQLAPLMKLPLARVSASTRFMILLYGMPLVYNPRRNVVYKNIGALGGQVTRTLFDPTFGSSYGTVAPVTR